MLWWMALVMLACHAPIDTDPTGETGDTGEPWVAPDGGIVELITRDDVHLEADYYPASSPSRPAVVLLHMIPPQFDRSTWPSEFIDRLHAHDWSVMVPDRRGAGASEGVAQDAYLGEGGRYDVEAAVRRLMEDGAGELGIIGASNGTTSMIDYTSWAAGEEDLPEAVVHGFMTGGDYTEAQTQMEQVTHVPSVITYATEEATWSEEQQPLDPGDWAFHAYPGAGHGTMMFDSTATVADDLDAYLASVLEP